MKYVLSASAALLFAGEVQGQTTVHVGPKAGLNISSSPYEDEFWKYDTKSLIRGEAGGMMVISQGRWALQLSAMYAQKGFRIDDEFRDDYNVQRSKRTYRLNYLTLPVSIAYTQYPNSKGFQLFAGGYAGVLLSGRYTYNDYYENNRSAGYTMAGELKLRKDDIVELSEGGVASRKLDAGLQGGVGYGYKNVLVQLGYSYGLTDLGVKYRQVSGTLYGNHYYSRVGQLSVAYLFGGKE